MNVKILWFYPSPKKRTEGFLGHLTIELVDIGIILRGVGVRKKSQHYSIYLPNRPQIGRDGEIFHHTLLDFKEKECKKKFVHAVSEIAPDYIKNYQELQKVDKFYKEEIKIVEEKLNEEATIKKKRGRPKKVK